MSDKTISHEELVIRMAASFQQMSGEDMAKVWNDMFPSMAVRYVEDSEYEWVKEGQG